jgi:hypothetical protein
MNAIPAVLLLLALAPPASPAFGPTGPAALMDEVESRLRLPEHSYRFEDYVRYYTVDAAGDLVGRFVIPRTFTPGPVAACAKRDGKGGRRKMQCARTISWPEGGVAGRRYWVADVGALPGILDGGCSVVNVRWNRKADRAEAVCNGLA